MADKTDKKKKPQGTKKGSEKKKAPKDTRATSEANSIQDEASKESLENRPEKRPSQKRRPKEEVSEDLCYDASDGVVHYCEDDLDKTFHIERTMDIDVPAQTQPFPELIQPTPENPDPHGIFIDEVQKRNKRIRQILSFTHSSTRAAAVMLIAAIVALIIANTPAYEPFLEFWHTEVFVGVGSLHGDMSLAHIINDIFMAVFFLLVGLEIKYEMTAGELTNIRQAILPILGAVGGVLAPIGIYLIFNASHPEAVRGWGVPTATDIAFALGILALLGDRVPSGVRVFLSTLAVADDIIAILVIAIFYGESPDFFWLAITAGVYIVLILMNRAHVYSLIPYILIGCFLWFCVFMSGIHSTIAGVLLAFVIPSGSRVNLQNFLSWSGERVELANIYYDGDNTPLVAQKKYITTVSSLSRVTRQAVPPATRLEQALYPWVYFFILPLFALTNADVSFGGLSPDIIVSSTVMLGVFWGLVLGKPIGIMLFSFLTIKLKIAKLPENVNWMHMFGAAILGGVGFTMAIFVANLAYADEILITEAKLSILMASVVAGLIGFCLLFFQAKLAHGKGVSYVSKKKDDDNLSHADREAARHADKVIDEIVDENLAEQLKREREDIEGTRELIVERKQEE